MQTYRMWITFNDGNRPYHNSYEVYLSDQDALNWIENYAKYYQERGYYWHSFTEYLLINLKTSKQFRGKF